MDLDGDRRLDLAVGNEWGQSVTVLRGDGAGGVLAQQDFAAGRWLNAVVAGDFDDDGRVDLASINGGSDVAVLLNTGDHCPADLDGNGAVDFLDLVRVLDAWGDDGGPADLDGSGTVEFGDLVLVLDAWGPCP